MHWENNYHTNIEIASVKKRVNKNWENGPRGNPHEKILKHVLQIDKKMILEGRSAMWEEIKNDKNNMWVNWLCKTKMMSCGIKKG